MNGLAAGGVSACWNRPKLYQPKSTTRGITISLSPSGRLDPRQPDPDHRAEREQPVTHIRAARTAANGSTGAISRTLRAEWSASVVGM